VLLVLKFGNLNFLEPSGHLGHVMGLIYLIYIYIYIWLYIYGYKKHHIRVPLLLSTVVVSGKAHVDLLHEFRQTDRQTEKRLNKLLIRVKCHAEKALKCQYVSRKLKLWCFDFSQKVVC